MAAKLLDGRSIAETLKAGLALEMGSLKSRCGRVPKLTALQIGEDGSSAVYVRSQRKAAEALGIAYELKVLGRETSQSASEEAIGQLNSDPSVSAIVLQLPVPKSIDAVKLSRMILAGKDADGMHPENVGRVVSGNYRIAPCTAMAVMELIEATGEKLYGREAVIVGHSDIVGKPVALMLLNKFVTTTVCHIATGERGALSEHVKRAEILVSAVGKPGIIKGEWVKRGAIVIDVGINKVGERIVGDVEFDSASERSAFITPVPGGVGPLTTMMLMRNTVELFKAQVS